MLLPFSDYPVTWSTIFIIDPIYTVPLVIAVVRLEWFTKGFYRVLQGAPSK